MSALSIRNQCIFLAVYSAVLLFSAYAMSDSASNTTATRYVCSACDARKQPSIFSSRKNAHLHITKSARCHGSKVKTVRIITRPGDVIAGGAGGMGQCPMPQHQPTGKTVCQEYVHHISRIYHSYSLNIYVFKEYTWNMLIIWYEYK